MSKTEVFCFCFFFPSFFFFAHKLRKKEKNLEKGKYAIVDGYWSGSSWFIIDGLVSVSSCPNLLGCPICHRSIS